MQGNIPRWFSKPDDPTVATECRHLRLRSLLRAPRARELEGVLTVALMLLIVVPLADEPENVVVLRARHAQDLLNELRAEMAVSEPVQIVLVVQNPLVFSVEPEDRRKNKFFLSMDVAFLERLDNTQLRAALAHELGHVWIFKHHPFLQTERQANELAQRVIARADLERMYRTLWTYQKTSGVPIDSLLGPADESVPAAGDRP